MRMLLIYDRPLDYPTEFVVREWYYGNGKVEQGPIVGRGQTLDEVRALIPPDMLPLPRCPEDNASIVESWV